MDISFGMTFQVHYLKLAENSNLLAIEILNTQLTLNNIYSKHFISPLFVSQTSPKGRLGLFLHITPS